jgi:hypothetical protein
MHLELLVTWQVLSQLTVVLASRQAELDLLLLANS